MKTLLKGIIVGIGGIAPGLSGSVLLVILGLYQKALNAISTLFKNFKKNIAFLIPLIIGFGIGVLIFSKVVDFFLNNFEMQTRFTFLGLVLGTIPLFFKEVKRNGFSKKYYIFIVVADFIGESNILNGVMVRDKVVKMYGREFPCVDGGFAPNEPVDVVIRPEDIDIVPVEQGQLVGTVTSVTFKGMQYDIIVDFRGFKWLIQTTDHSPEGARIGVKIDPDGFHIMKKSEYSGQFGDYSSYSEEYEELADASLETDEEESGDEE